MPAGGDGDTVQAADFLPAAGFELAVTSVARYVFDLGDWERSAWIVPLGASGHPGSTHYADQAADWAAVRLRPMRYGWTRVAAEAESHQRLEPAGPADAGCVPCSVQHHAPSLTLCERRVYGRHRCAGRTTALRSVPGPRPRT